MSDRSDHIYHVFLNAEQQGKPLGEFDHSAYLWKDAYSFMQYGHKRIQQAFEGGLPVLHQQCSHSPVEKVEGNRLLCCLGPQVDTCPILLRLKATFEEHWNRPPVESSGYDTGKYYREGVTAEDMYKTMAKVCAHHVYEESKKTFIDASEGFHLDSTDRIFWERTYASMAQSDDAPEDE